MKRLGYKRARSDVRAIVAAVLAAPLLAGASAAGIDFPGHGGTFGASDLSGPPSTTSAGLTGLQVRFHDANANGFFDEGDTAYLLPRPTATVTTTPALLRLTPFGAYAAGTIPAATDADQGAPLFAPAAGIFGYGFRFHDADDDSQLGPGDTLYLRTCQPDSSNALDCRGTNTTVREKWVRITAWDTKEPGTIVAATDGDVGRPTTSSGIGASPNGAAGAQGEGATDVNWAYADRDKSSTFSAGDLMYWHTRQDFGATSYRPLVDEIRLGGGAFGRFIGPADDDAAGSTIKKGITGLQVRFADDGRDGGWDRDEPLYLITASTDDVPAGAIRLHATGSAGGLGNGTRVRAGEPDHGRAILAAGAADFGYSFRYMDVDGDTRPGAADRFYLVACRSSEAGAMCETQETIQPGWIRLRSADVLVEQGDVDQGCRATTAGLVAPPSGATDAAGLPASATNFAYWDLDADGAFGMDDRLVWHTRQGPAASSYLIQVGDVAIGDAGQDAPITGCPVIHAAGPSGDDPGSPLAHGEGDAAADALAKPREIGRDDELPAYLREWPWTVGTLGAVVAVGVVAAMLLRQRTFPRHAARLKPTHTVPTTPRLGSCVVLEFNDVDERLLAAVRRVLDALARDRTFRAVVHEGPISRVLADNPVQVRATLQNRLGVQAHVLRAVRLENLRPDDPWKVLQLADAEDP